GSVAQVQRNPPDPAPPPAGFQVPGVPPINLRLFPGRCLNPATRRRVTRLSLRVQPAFQEGVSTAVTALAQLPQQHLSVPHTGIQPVLQIRLVWIELARLP